MAVELLRFPDRDAWCDAIVTRAAAQIKAGIDARGQASIVVSGGSTPAPIYQRLAGLDLPWEQVQVTLADERWVPPEHAASNQRLVMETLFSEVPEPARHFLPLWREGLSLQEAVADIEVSLRRMARPFDLVLLGLGNDGHTASLFPGQPETVTGMQADRQCVANLAPNQPRERISLGLGALTDAREILITITGRAKLEVLEQAQQAGPELDLPVRAMLRQSRAPVRVYWAP